MKPVEKKVPLVSLEEKVTLELILMQPLEQKVTLEPLERDPGAPFPPELLPERSGNLACSLLWKLVMAFVPKQSHSGQALGWPFVPKQSRALG